MKRLMVFLWLIATASAWADGVLLSTPAPSPSLTDPAVIEIYKNPAVVSVKAIHLNRNAMHSNIIRLNIEGKEREFVGSMLPFNPNASPCWSGKELAVDKTVVNKMQNLLTLCQDTPGGPMDAGITTFERTYEIVNRGGRELLIEKDRGHNVPLVPFVPQRGSKQ